MPSRVIAFLLAIVLLWSGAHSVEAPGAMAGSLPSSVQMLSLTSASSDAAATQPGSGSFEHHHLDDLPSQALIDPSLEPPALLPQGPQPALPRLTLARPCGLSLVAGGSPFLAGLLRPPCAAPNWA